MAQSVPSGLVTLSSVNVLGVPVLTVLAERVIYGAPFGWLAARVNPVAGPPCEPSVAEVVLNPCGVVQVPLAVRQ